MTSPRRPLRAALVAIVGLALVAPAQLGSSAAAAPLPDLKVSALGTDARTVAAGGQLGVDVTVKNSGRKKAGRSLTRFYLSRDDSWSKADLLLGAKKVPALDGGGVSRRSVPLSVPGTVAPRRYFVVACADTKRRVQESREGNNCRAAADKLAVTEGDEATFPMDPDPLSVDSTVQSGRAVTTTAVAAPADGATTMSATAQDGTEYTLEIPYRALLTSEEITMTPVASVDGLPMAGGLVAGVQIEPHGLLLQREATLTIESPDAGALASQTGFIFDGNGDDLHLYPLAPPEDGDTKDVIRMHLTHFSTPGVGAATPAERANLENHPPVSSQGQLEQEVADLLRGERQDQLSGEPPDPGVMQQVVSRLNSYFDSVLRSRMQAAEGNADVGPQTIAEALAWVRQMLLLGVKDNPRVQEAMDRVEKIAKNMMVTFWKRCTTEHDLGASIGLVGLARQALLIGWSWGEEAADKAQRCANFEVRFDSLITHSSSHGGTVSTNQTDGRWRVESKTEVPWTGFGTGPLSYSDFSYSNRTDYPPFESQCVDPNHYNLTTGTSTDDGSLTGLVGVRANPSAPPAGRPLPPVLYVRIGPGLTYQDFQFGVDRPAERYHQESYSCDPSSDDFTETQWMHRFEMFHTGPLEWELPAVKNEVLLSESWNRSVPTNGGATTEKTVVELWHKPLT